MTLAITCSQTQETRQTTRLADGSPKLPMGWKRLGGQILSPAGVEALFVPRVIVLPIVKPVDCTWDELGKALRDCWAEAAWIGNMVVRQIAATEAPVKPGEKLKGMKLDTKPIYALAREHVPQFPTGSLSQLMQLICKSYKAARFDMFVRGTRSLLSFRAGRLPLPIRRQDWTGGINAENGDLLLSVRLGSEVAEGVRSRRLTVILGAGRKHARHARVFRQVVAGEVEARDVKLTQDSDGKAWARVTVMLPRRKPAADGVLSVRTDATNLLVWRCNDDEERPPLHADQIRRALRARTAQNKRFADDLKFEKRWPARTRRRIVARSRRASRYWDHLIGTSIEQVAAMVVGFAKRRGCCKIVYDDNERGFAPLFEWYGLRQAIENAAGAEGIEVVSAAARPQGDQGRDV